jgi:hypothetical protein
MNRDSWTPRECKLRTCDAALCAGSYAALCKPGRHFASLAATLWAGSSGALAGIQPCMASLSLHAAACFQSSILEDTDWPPSG